MTQVETLDKVISVFAKALVDANTPSTAMLHIDAFNTALFIARQQTSPYDIAESEVLEDFFKAIIGLPHRDLDYAITKTEWGSLWISISKQAAKQARKMISSRKSTP